jgi:hypothetical protein
MSEESSGEQREALETADADLRLWEQRARELSRPGYRVTVMGLRDEGDELPAEWEGGL